MYKRLLTGLFTVTVLSLGHTLIPSLGQASAEACTTKKELSHTYSSYKSYIGNELFDEMYSTPTSPKLENKEVRDRSLTGGDFSSTYTYTYYKKVFRTDFSYPVYNVYEVCGTGSAATTTLKGTSNGSTTTGKEYHWYNIPYNFEYNATIEVKRTSGSPTSGHETFTATAKGKQNKQSSSSGHRSYYVDAVTVKVSDDKTYEDEPFPTVTCQKTYGTSVKYNKTADCKEDLSVKDNESTSIRNICYHYSERGHTGEDCTQRVYVERVAVSGPNTTYTGKHHEFGCVALFHDGYMRTVTGKDFTMSSAPYNYIGDKWLSTGWKAPDGTVHYPNSANDFYPLDAEDRTYTISCAYYPDVYGNQKGYLVADTVKQKVGTKKVNHVGIDRIDIDSSGYFSNGNNEYAYVDKVPKSSDGKKTVGAAYLKNHWYDFKATLYYTDGSKRNITSAPEVYWTSSPSQGKDTNMPQSGLSHRIPADGTNKITVEYMNRNVPYGGNSTATRQTLEIQAKQIQKLEIRDGSGYGKAPNTNVKLGDIVSYSAWVTWSNGEREDWTDLVTWSGVYSLGEGDYHFSQRGNSSQSTKTTVTATYNDGESKTDGNATSLSAKLDVNIQFDCSKITSLTYGCGIPKGTWQTEPYLFFESKNTNFLPPPSAYGLNNLSWFEKGKFIPEYPYSFAYKFNVSGVSEGH